MHTGAEHPALSIELEHAVVAAFRPEARRRDVSVARLVQDLLGTIAADGLVTAVLDDLPPPTATTGAAPRTRPPTLGRPLRMNDVYVPDAGASPGS
jgi:hypothetical protein